MAEPIVVVVPLNAGEGRGDDLIAAMTPCIEATIAEEGCIKYALHRDKANPDAFVHLEVWRSQADLDEHGQKPYLKALYKSMAEPGLLAGAPPMMFAESVGVGGAKGSMA